MKKLSGYFSFLSEDIKPTEISAASRMNMSEDDDDMPDYVVSPPRVHTGPNIRSSNSGADDEKRQVEVSSSSRVFMWVTCIIGIPILLTASKLNVL